jgi:chaperone modulatory protein CbpM
VSYALMRPPRLDLDALAALTGTHPDLIRRLVTLGLIDARRDGAGGLWFAPAQVAALARIQRLRAGLALNYAAVGLVTDLLERIAVLETALRRSRREGAVIRGGAADGDLTVGDENPARPEGGGHAARPL